MGVKHQDDENDHGARNELEDGGKVGASPPGVVGAVSVDEGEANVVPGDTVCDQGDGPEQGPEPDQMPFHVADERGQGEDEEDVRDASNADVPEMLCPKRRGEHVTGKGAEFRGLIEISSGDEERGCCRDNETAREEDISIG